MTENQSFDDFTKRNLLVLEEEGFSVREENVNDIFAEKQTLSGRMVFYMLTRYEYCFRLSSVSNNINLSFRSVKINNRALNAETIQSDEKQLNLIVSLSRETIAFLQAKNYSLFFQQAKENENSFHFGKGGFDFELSFYVSYDSIGAVYCDTSSDRIGIVRKYESLFKISKEDILDKDINFLHDMYLEKIKNNLSKLLKINE